MQRSSGHGYVKVYWKGNQLIVEPESIFNVEGLIEASRVINAQVDKKPVENWIRVIHFKKNDIVGPVDGAKYIVESVQYSADNGCQRICVIGGNPLNKKGYQAVCDSVGIDVSFYESLETFEQDISIQKAQTSA